MLGRKTGLMWKQLQLVVVVVSVPGIYWYVPVTLAGVSYHIMHMIAPDVKYLVCIDLTTNVCRTRYQVRMIRVEHESRVLTCVRVFFFSINRVFSTRIYSTLPARDFERWCFMFLPAKQKLLSISGLPDLVVFLCWADPEINPQYSPDLSCDC